MSNNERILTEIQRIAQKTTDSYRKTLNNKIHVADISYKALKYSEPDLTIEEYNELVSKIKIHYKNFNSLKEALSIARDKSTVRGFSAYVEDSAYGVYLIGKTYGALQGKLVNILKSIEHTSIFTHTEEYTTKSGEQRSRTITNIGHIPGSDKLDALKSPLKSKLIDIIKNIPIGNTNLLNPLIVELNNLYNVHTFDTEYSYQREDISKPSLNRILSGTILVTLHSQERNNNLAIIEKAISLRVSELVNSKEYVEELLNSRGSNSILEDISLQITETILGKPISKKPHKVKKFTNSFKINDETKLSPISLRFRNEKGKFAKFNLTNIQSLLNYRLHDTIRKNMESPALNYRTGRFAHSAEVKKLSISREGMVSAFYTYMKNPYQTFEPGYAQGSQARNPKTLISKSIREIATEIVGNKLRAISL